MGRAIGAVVGLWAIALTGNRSLRRVTGDSMAPALRDGDLVLVVPARLARPVPGTVVVARAPRRAGRPSHPGRRPDGAPWIKRLAAMGPARYELVTDLRTIEVPAGQVLLLGDNPAASTDGRLLGPTPLADVTHRVVCRLPGRRPRPDATSAGRPASHLGHRPTGDPG